MIKTEIDSSMAKNILSEIEMEDRITGEMETFLVIQDSETGLSVLAKVEIETVVPVGKDITAHLCEDYEDCPMD